MNPETIRILAQAILEISKQAPHAWDDDGELRIVPGIDLGPETVKALKRLAGEL
jgi:hypothetical protein